MNFICMPLIAFMWSSHLLIIEPWQTSCRYNGEATFPSRSGGRLVRSGGGGSRVRRFLTMIVGWGDNLTRHTSFVPGMKGEKGWGVWESCGEADSTQGRRALQPGSSAAYQLFDETRVDRAHHSTAARGLAHKAQGRHARTHSHTTAKPHWWRPPARVTACNPI